MKFIVARYIYVSYSEKPVMDTVAWEKVVDLLKITAVVFVSAVQIILNLKILRRM